MVEEEKDEKVVEMEVVEEEKVVEIEEEVDVEGQEEEEEKVLKEGVEPSLTYHSLVYSR